MTLTGSFRKMTPKNIAHTVIRLPRLEKNCHGQHGCAVIYQNIGSHRAEHAEKNSGHDKFSAVQRRRKRREISRTPTSATTAHNPITK